MTEPDIGVLAAVVARQAADLSLYADFITTVLAGSLASEQVTVRRERRRFGRGSDDAAVLSVAVHLNDRIFTLRRASGKSAVTATIEHVVNGVVLSTKTTDLGRWTGQVARALVDVTESNADAAAALARITRLTI